MRVFILSLCVCARIVRCVFLKVTLMVNGIIVRCVVEVEGGGGTRLGAASKAFNKEMALRLVLSGK